MTSVVVDIARFNNNKNTIMNEEIKEGGITVPEVPWHIQFTVGGKSAK